MFQAKNSSPRSEGKNLKKSLHEWIIVVGVSRVGLEEHVWHRHWSLEAQEGCTKEGTVASCTALEVFGLQKALGLELFPQNPVAPPLTDQMKQTGSI